MLSALVALCALCYLLSALCNSALGILNSALCSTLSALCSLWPLLSALYSLLSAASALCCLRSAVCALCCLCSLLSASVGSVPPRCRRQCAARHALPQYRVSLPTEEEREYERKQAGSHSTRPKNVKFEKESHFIRIEWKGSFWCDPATLNAKVQRVSFFFTCYATLDSCSAIHCVVLF